MSTHTLDLVPPDQDDMLSRLLWRTLGEVEILRLRRDELLAANNLTEEQRREAVRQCKVSRETIHVLQEALHARNETIAGFKTEISELEQLDEELKEIRDQYKSRISAAEATVGRCQRALNNGWQLADVPCYWVMDHPSYGAKSIIRTDTGEVVQTEPMEDFDRQRVLEFEAAPQATVTHEPDGRSVECGEYSAHVDDGATHCTITGPDGVCFEGTTGDLKEAVEYIKRDPDKVRTIADRMKKAGK
jgi:hypothetical protein